MSITKEIIPPPVETPSNWKPSAVIGRINDLSAKLELDVQTMQTMQQTISVLNASTDKKLAELEQKINTQVSNIKSGKSNTHEVPPYSSGTIYISVPEEKPICIIVSTLLCSDDFGSILCYQKKVADDNVLQFCVENLLNRERSVSINYLYKTI